MKRLLPLLCLIPLLFLGCEDIETLGGCDSGVSLDNYDLVWSDEFDGTEIDRSKWSFEIGDGCDRNLCNWGNNELQYYTDRPENAFISSSGNLVIRARRETPAFEGYEYTSTRMHTGFQGDWTYGRFDIRAKMPIGQGLWPAIWMLPTDTTYGIWPKSGEIDIMELTGDKPNEIFGTVHYGHDFWRFLSQEYILPAGNFSDDFHVFSCVWTEDCIRFFVDDIEFATPITRSSTLPTTWPFDQRFHLILNVAVGGNLPGPPNAATTFPQLMQVDYVRVYERKSNLQ